MATAAPMMPMTNSTGLPFSILVAGPGVEPGSAKGKIAALPLRYPAHHCPVLRGRNDFPFGNIVPITPPNQNEGRCLVGWSCHVANNFPFNGIVGEVGIEATAQIIRRTAVAGNEVKRNNGRVLNGHSRRKRSAKGRWQNGSFRRNPHGRCAGCNAGIVNAVYDIAEQIDARWQLERPVRVIDDLLVFHPPIAD